MAHALRVPPLFITQSLRHRAGEVRSELDTLIIRLMAAPDEDEGDTRLSEARRLIKLAEELYKRADELVKQAEELLPADELPRRESE